jgi:hypothetical protein
MKRIKFVIQEIILLFIASAAIIGLGVLAYAVMTMFAR